MRIVCIADTHGKHIPQVPAGDMLLVAGDFTQHATKAEWSKFDEWMRSLPIATKFVVAGNHDPMYTPNGPPLQYATYLYNTSAVCNGLLVFGSPIMPPTPQMKKRIAVKTIEFTGIRLNNIFKHIGIHVSHMTSESRVWKSRIPTDCDILLTHIPPYGVMDMSIDPNNGAQNHWGDSELSEYFDGLENGDHPLLHVFGHVHDEPGVKIMKEWSHMVAVNASVAYNSEPIVVDIG